MATTRLLASLIPPLKAAFDELGSGLCIYVGDSEIDAETAQRAEVPFILFTEGYRKIPVDQIPHDVALNSFSELATKINEIYSANIRRVTKLYKKQFHG